jgi:hypothetical protein
MTFTGVLVLWGLNKVFVLQACERNLVKVDWLKFGFGWSFSFLLFFLVFILLLLLFFLFSRVFDHVIILQFVFQKTSKLLLSTFEILEINVELG